MTEKNDLYTGKLEFRDIEFTFVFDRRQLFLVPPKEKEYEIQMEWAKKELEKGVYTWADPEPVGVDYLVGICNETKKKIIFLPSTVSYIGYRNSTVVIPLTAYIICKYDRDSIDRLIFKCPEIDFIHPVNTALSLTLPSEEEVNNGVFTLSTNGYDQTTTEKQIFDVDGKKVSVHFSISRTISTSINNPPLRLDSCMIFEFEPTDEYVFILRLWVIARRFLGFLCYRKNVYLPEVDIGAPYENGKHESFATMYILEETGKTEIETLKKGRYISQFYIAGHEGQILTDIAVDKIYLRHLPETYKSGRHKDAARFVMITAAFEWEFRRFYPNGVSKSDATINAENEIAEHIQNCINDNSGKKKNIYKFLQKLVRSNSLSSEIVQIGKDFSSVIDVLGNRLYQLNNETLKYSEMGDRLSAQRNHFAHGDLDKDFIGLSLLDLQFMEYIVYAIQLKYYGVDDLMIQKAINELFGLRIAL